LLLVRRSEKQVLAEERHHVILKAVGDRDSNFDILTGIALLPPTLSRRVRAFG
jgi:hypothetical protein